LKGALSILLFVMAIGVPTHKTSSKTVSLQMPGSMTTRNSWEGLAIVVNPKNPIDDVRLAELREIFSGDRRWWSHQRRVRLVAMPAAATERQTVLRVLYQMSKSDLDKYFFLGVFRGDFAPNLTTVATAGDVKKFVASTPGAIGYLRASDVDHSLKVVRVNGLLPDDDGYPLRLRTRTPN
jgi:phosphate transport system substrate-binding protein